MIPDRDAPLYRPPPPGVYEDVPFDAYAHWPYLSNSRLAPAARSMKHFREQVLTDETDAMRFGQLCHMGQLDPLLLPLRYAVAPRFEDTVRRPDGSAYKKPKASNAYRDERRKFAALHSGKQVIDADDYSRMIAVCRALREHDRAREYLAGPGPVELSIVWDDPGTGLRCKSRLDKLDRRANRITDLKTCRDPLDFERQIKLRGYHRQAAMYVDAVKAATGRECEYCLVVVESDQPYGVRAAPLSLDAIEEGRTEYLGLLKRLAACIASQEWPGYEDPDVWELPAWGQSEPMLTFEGELLEV